MGIDRLEQEIANESSEPVRVLNSEVNGNGILEMSESEPTQYSTVTDDESQSETRSNNASEITENNIAVLRHRGGSNLQITKSSKSTSFTPDFSSGSSTTSTSAGEGSSRAIRRGSQSKSNDNHTNNSGSEYECNIW
jgi:hypothetical protein